MVKPYEITEHSLRKARELNVEIKPSTNKHKKLDVFKDGEKIATIGARNYSDFGTYLNMEARGELPKGYAADRRRLYKLRHKYDRGVNSFYANRLLW